MGLVIIDQFIFLEVENIYYTAQSSDGHCVARDPAAFDLVFVWTVIFNVKNRILRVANIFRFLHN